MTYQFVPTTTNMVAIVRNIIQGYRMGPIRALAQEPVQNSKDAARGQVHVEYRLHKRRSVDGVDSYMLTVTDHNTSGLDGPVLSFKDIEQRGNVLGKDHNWAAFEGMGYTKEDEDALGSARGNGSTAEGAGGEAWIPSTVRGAGEATAPRSRCARDREIWARHRHLPVAETAIGG